MEDGGKSQQEDWWERNVWFQEPEFCGDDTLSTENLQMHIPELEFGRLIEINNLSIEKMLMVSKLFLDLYSPPPIIIVPKQPTGLPAPTKGWEKSWLNIMVRGRERLKLHLSMESEMLWLCLTLPGHQ